MTATRLPGFPDWLRNVDANLPVTAQYVLHGNIRDWHLIDGGFRSTTAALWETLRASGFEFLLYHSPVHGLQVVPESAAELAEQVVPKSAIGRAMSYDALVTVMRKVTGTPETKAALVVDYVSQHAPGAGATRQPPSPELHEFMLACLRQVHEGYPHDLGEARAAYLFHPVFWLVDLPADLPAWLVGGSDGIRQIVVPFPDIDARIAAARALGDPGDTVGAERFADASAGLTVRAMTAVGQLSADLGSARIDDAVRAYRLGLVDNPWKRPELRRRIVGDPPGTPDARPDAETALGERVLGQPRAVRHVTDILVRATTGLSGAWQASRSAGPRGVLFFAGPTGVGKTELAKAVTELVFGDERSYTRFDMSEFSAEHTEARLIGAPPGYVGHGVSGELTDAVRRRPFSLLLFDEIEKAHPLILDKFLQILSDGRLTDGTGATVDFSETVIVFTSNVGMTGLSDRDIAADAEAFEARLREAVDDHFRLVLQRPELLGRIGDNIVVFHHLDEAVGRELVQRYLDNVAARVREESGVSLVVPEPVAHQLADWCVGDLSLGGRGIGQRLDTCFVNPLGRALIRHDGDTAVVTSVIEKDDAFEVVLG